MEKEQMKSDPLFNLLEIIKVRKVKVIIGFLIVFAMTVAGVLVMPSVYETSAKVGLSLPVVSRSAEVVPYLEELRDIKSFVANQPVVASSRPIYEKAVIALGLNKREGKPSLFGRLKGLFFKEEEKDPLAEAMDELYRITDVRALRGTNIIQFSARAGSSEGAAQIANTLAKTYIDYENGVMVSRTQMAYDIISGELENARNAFNASQNALNALKKSMSVYDDPSVMKKNLADYNIKYEEIQERIQRLESQPTPPKTVEVKKAKPEKTRPIQPAESPRVRELKANLKNLKTELDIGLRRYTEQHPTIKRLRSRIAAVEEELSREEKASPAESSQPLVETELDSPAEPVVNANTGPDINELKTRRDNLARQIQTLEGKLSRASLIGVDQERLSRDANQKELEYTAAKEKLDRARILRDQAREGPIKIIDPAAPPAYASMKKKTILLIVGLIASLIFGIAVGFISEYYEDVFKSPEEVEKSLNLPVLATIPRIPKMTGNGKSRSKVPLIRSKRDSDSDRKEVRM
jgi:uncharacterized protein involved in exopolysaccharide biosynthesis